MKKIKPATSYTGDSSSLVSLVKGKIPPQALDLEDVVLGAMMIDKKGVDTVIDILHPEAFYKQAHQHIYEAIIKLFENTEPIDLVTVSAQLRKDSKLDQVGGDFYLVQLTQKSIFIGAY
jgi:replicative DNA helicase